MIEKEEKNKIKQLYDTTFYYFTYLTT